MVNISLFDKIKQFFEIMGSNNNVWLVIAILLIISFCILLSCKMNDKFMKVFYVVLYLGILGLIMCVYNKQVLELVDYLIENIIANVLFPNLAIYIGVLIFINIVVLISLFSRKVRLYVKNINIIFFAIMQLFLYLIAENVMTNSVNVYEKLSIYTNQNLLILVELSMQLFVIWMLGLGVIWLADYLMAKASHKVIVQETNVPVNNKQELANVKSINEVNLTNYNQEIYEVYEDYYRDYYDENDYMPLKKTSKNA